MMEVRPHAPGCGEFQVQKVRHVNQPQYRPDNSWDWEQPLVMLQMRNDDPHAATVGNQVADTSGKCVSHPVSTGAVGQRDHVTVTAVEHIDGRLIDATAPPTTVNDDLEIPGGDGQAVALGDLIPDD